MIWLDLLAAGIILGAVFAESKRQFSAAFFDMLALLAAVKLAKLIAPGLAHAVVLLRAPDDNQALALSVLSLVFGGALVALANFLKDLALLTLDAFDTIAGAIFGFVSGVAVAHVILFIILTANPAATTWGAAARQRPAAQEIVYFHSYQRAVNWLRHLGE